MDAQRDKSCDELLRNVAGLAHSNKDGFAVSRFRVDDLADGLQEGFLGDWRCSVQVLEMGEGKALCSKNMEGLFDGPTVRLESLVVETFGDFWGGDGKGLDSFRDGTRHGH